MPEVTSSDSILLWRKRIDQERDKYSFGAITSDDARYGVITRGKPHLDLEVAEYSVESERADK